MAVDRCPEHVILEGGHALPGVERAEERRCVGVRQLTVLELWRVVILARFLQQNKHSLSFAFNYLFGRHDIRITVYI